MLKIPLHKLEDRAANGLEIRHTSFPGVKEEFSSFQVHRDDNYIFLLVESGDGSLVVDFETVSLRAGEFYFIAPGQVHYDIRANHAACWSLAIHPTIIPKELVKVFEHQLLQQQPRMPGKKVFDQCLSVIESLYEQVNSDGSKAFYQQLCSAFLQCFLTVAASIYSPALDGQPSAGTRPLQITSAFRQLLATHVKKEKSPSFYAAQLHISEIYLNEAVKKTTGCNITHWIMNEVILEARRLLSYSDMSVKEIAYLLGYEDYAYFSRVFKKATQTSPVAFRANYLK